MANIKIMDELLANKIAAGEVVERCVSVVKELVENSVDAKASEIKIELIEAGTKQIKVTDNGTGMNKEDALLAFSRHATSKLIDEDDLFNINTLGFRGEALPSIASVSEITLKTSTSNNVGTIIKLKGGILVSNEKGDARKGTSISVNNLFYNTPARLKHMKSLYTELANIVDYVNKIALSYPNIKFVLTNNNQILLNTEGKGDLLKVINNIFGLDVTKKMMIIKGNTSDYEISGFISKPEVNRSNRNGIITIVNGRVVKNVDLNRTINEAYHGYKPDTRYPITVIKIDTDPSIIDVNIHPTKMDIRFSKLEELLEEITTIIRKVLDHKVLIPEVDTSYKEEKKLDIYTPIKYEELTLDLEKVKEENIKYEEVKKESLIINDDYLKEEAEEPKERLKELYPVGLVHGTYIICQNEDGMYIIDQHAAKERINYEYYKEKLGNPNKDVIGPLFPITIELSNNDYLILKENFDVLSNIGFSISEFGINSVIIKRHPTWLPKGYEEEAIKRIIEVVIEKEKDFSIAKFNEKLAMMLSCKMSIKANENITLNEMTHLISDLRKCNNPFNCPHGRPTIISYSNYELEKLFKRSGF